MIGQYVVKKGNILTPQLLYDSNDVQEKIVIPHVCNNLGVMGAGVALALKNKWPQVEEEYLYLKEHGGLKLGEICWASVGERSTVVNMIAQDGVVGKNNSKPIKYYALVDCMRYVKYRIDFLKENTTNKYVIHSPKFGSDLAGGKWEFISELIREIWIENGIDVVVYEYK